MELDNFDKNHKKSQEKMLRRFPFVKFYDLKKNKIEKRKISVANIQIETPDHFFTQTKPPRLTPEAEIKQKEKIFRLVTESMNQFADLIILPELSTSENICKEINKKFSNTKSIIVMGSYYDNNSQNMSQILFDGSIYSQIKNNPSPDEKEYMSGSNDISIFINTPIGDFAVLICYDATDFSILTAIKEYTDFLICVARTKDLPTFKNIFSALAYLQYHFVIFCNDAQYGGSSFYAPFHHNRMLDVLGQKNEGILYRDFDLLKLDNMRAKPIKDDAIFKYPPASIKPRHIPNVKINTRTKEFFKSKSFNYLSYIRTFPILDSFLAHVNASGGLSSIGGKQSGSIYRLDDILLKSCVEMYAPAIPLRNMNLSPIVLKYFLLGLTCNKKNLLEKKKPEIIKNLSNIQGKQYLLFEIDLDRIKDAALTIPELIDEIIRVYDSEKEKNIRNIPKELQNERINQNMI